MNSTRWLDNDEYINPWSIYKYIVYNMWAPRGVFNSFRWKDTYGTDQHGIDPHVIFVYIHSEI